MPRSPSQQLLRGSSSRKYGIGYATMAAAVKGFAVQHTSAVPFGDDPVVLLEVVVSNTGAAASSATTVRYSEVFSSFMVQMTPDNFAIPGTDRRAFAETHYNSSFGLLPGGAAHSRGWRGLSSAEAAHVEGTLGNRILPKGASVYDTAPPTSFLVSLIHQEAASKFRASNDGRAFFANAGPAAHPPCKMRWQESVAERDASLILSADVTVSGGKNQSLFFMYGFLPGGLSTDAVASAVSALSAKYRTMLRIGHTLHPRRLAEAVASGWAPHLPRVSLEAAPWLGPETTWNAFYLQAGASHDNFFGESIINQVSHSLVAVRQITRIVMAETFAYCT
jgi:hypothetical protein